jgi:cytochrome c-type biogenesis protein CcmE
MTDLAPARAIAAPAPSPRPRPKRSRRRLGAFLGVLLVAAGFLVYKGLNSAVVYFKTAAQAVADRPMLGNSTFQIEGLVRPGSLRHDGAKIVAFTITSGKTAVSVQNSGDPPQLFQPNIPVVLVGHFVGSTDTFASNEILVKHTNQYIAAHPQRVEAPNGTKR